MREQTSDRQMEARQNYVLPAPLDKKSVPYWLLLASPTGPAAS